MRAVLLQKGTLLFKKEQAHHNSTSHVSQTGGSAVFFIV